MIGAWLAAAQAAEPACAVTVDGAPAATLDCLAGLGWRLSCTLPTAGPKVRVRATIEALGLRAEARVPYLNESRFDLPLSSAFLAVSRVGGVAEGAPIGPSEWCPADPPGAAGTRPTTPLVLEIVSHRQTGFAEEELAGGVMNRVPTYDAGAVIETLTVPIVQRNASGDALVGGTPNDRPIRARLQLKDPAGAWVPVSISGVRRDVPVTPGAVRLLVVDLVTAELAALGDPVGVLRADLQGWFGGDPSSMLGLVAWSKSDLPAPQALTWSGATARAERVDLRIARGPTATRVVLGWREQGMDAAARKVVDEAVAAAP